MSFNQIQWIEIQENDSIIKSYADNINIKKILDYRPGTLSVIQYRFDKREPTDLHFSTVMQNYRPLFPYKEKYNLNYKSPFRGL